MSSSESSGLYDDPRLLLVKAVNDPLCLLEAGDVENTVLEEFIQDDDEYDDRSSVEEWDLDDLDRVQRVRMRRMDDSGILSRWA
jgi:hypothetical protein